jgi:hypothetical protein
LSLAEDGLCRALFVEGPHQPADPVIHEFLARPDGLLEISGFRGRRL